MSRYHIHLTYAISFAMTGAKQYTVSETNMQIVTKHEGYHKLQSARKPNPEAYHQEVIEKRKKEA